MVNVGDKFIVEVEKIWGRPDGKKMYFMKGFNTLVFDDNGINKLEKYDPKPEKPKKETVNFKIGDVIYQPGYTTKNIVLGCGEDFGGTWGKIYKIFDTKTNRITYLTYEEASKWSKAPLFQF